MSAPKRSRSTKSSFRSASWRGSPAFSVRSLWCSRASGFTACFPTKSRVARVNSAFAWRWARSVAICCASSSARGFCLCSSAQPSESPRRSALRVSFPACCMACTRMTLLHLLPSPFCSRWSRLPPAAYPRAAPLTSIPRRLSATNDYAHAQQQFRAANRERSKMITRLRQLLHRLRSFFHRRRLDRELDAELRSHLEMAVERNLRQGMSPEQARREALLDFGGLEQTKEVYRERRGLPFLETLLQDLRFAFRILRKSPGFTAVAVLTLALGMGATTTIIFVVNSVLLRPLPYTNSDRLLRVQETHPADPGANLTYATFLDLQREARTMENVAAYREWIFNVTGGSEPTQIAGALVSANFFAALGSTPTLGRTILAEDDQPGGDNHVVVLSYALWQSRFGSDSNILGQKLMVNAEPFTVIGVMPPGFDFPAQSELWCPLVPGGELHGNRRAHLLTVLANIGHGQSTGAANGELTTVAKSVESRNPRVDDPSLTLSAATLQRSLTAPVRPALVILLFAVGLLLVIACANVANLLLARTAARGKEIAVRLALGASRARLTMLLLTESVFMSLLGGAAGLLLAQAGLAFIRTQSTQNLPRFSEIHLDLRVFAFSFGVSILSGLFFGLAPALAGSKLNLNAPLKEGHWETAGAKRRVSSNTLTVLQFGLATILLAAAGLLAGSLLRVLSVNPGFNPDHLLTLQVFLSPVKYPERDSKSAITLHEMLENIRALPGVQIGRA